MQTKTESLEVDDLDISFNGKPWHPVDNPVDIPLVPARLNDLANVLRGPVEIAANSGPSGNRQSVLFNDSSGICWLNNYALHQYRN